MKQIPRKHIAILSDFLTDSGSTVIDEQTDVSPFFIYRNICFTVCLSMRKSDKMDKVLYFSEVLALNPMQSFLLV